VASGDLVFMEGEKGGRFPDANCMFVDDGIPAVIDPATRRSDLEAIVRDNGVEVVINSHYHVDHTRYDSVFDCRVVAHEIDAPGISSLEGQARLVGTKGKSWEPMWSEGITRYLGFVPVPVGTTVTDGDEICLGDNTLRFIHTPGHTPGHMCVHFLEKRAVYLADIDLTSFGPWYGNRFSSVDDFLLSIDRLRGLDAEVWYTAHEEGEIQGDISERLDAFERIIFEREERILSYLDRERTLGEMVDRLFIYGRRWRPNEMFEFFEGTMVTKHLERLERLGVVERRGRAWALT
jgi:glyoxylase-like metal-dependent hydrolase (beta-lactamase superfamily II)